MNWGAEMNSDLKNTKLWQVFEEKVNNELTTPDNQNFIVQVGEICTYGIDRARTINLTFPMYTMHDWTHIKNVLDIMCKLLGDKLNNITCDEAAVLLIAGCCHDVGMSYDKKEKEELIEDSALIEEYLDKHAGYYNRVYKDGFKELKTLDDIPKDIMNDFMRSIHHKRSNELIRKFFYKESFSDNLLFQIRVGVENIASVCQSHGESFNYIQNNLVSNDRIDLKLCAVLLRLSDILDFDTSRAPKTLYDFFDLENVESKEEKISKNEWKKHSSSRGFDFPKKREPYYNIEYNACCESIQIEQAIRSYIDWVKAELCGCSQIIKTCNDRWRNFILPMDVDINIVAHNYLSGEYRFTFDQEKILELFAGENLYDDPYVFVRELLQNAIDAVLTRKQIDKNLPQNWKPEIKIRCWRDNEGYDWFRIEDNGTGMNLEVIMNHLLKVGNSYYTSDSFKKEMLASGNDVEYSPISKFGIGMLSCFLEKDNKVYISTYHYKDKKALRLEIPNMSGYYYVSSEEKHHIPNEMKGVTDTEKKEYLNKPGTVIAVRTALYKTTEYTCFKDIVDKYLLFPPFSVVLQEGETIHRYTTQDEFMNAMESFGAGEKNSPVRTLKIPLTSFQKEKVSSYLKNFESGEKLATKIQNIIIDCVLLNKYSNKLSGVIVVVYLENKLPDRFTSYSLRVIKDTMELNVDFINPNKNNFFGIMTVNIQCDFTAPMKEFISHIKKEYYFNYYICNGIRNVSNSDENMYNEFACFFIRNSNNIITNISREYVENINIEEKIDISMIITSFLLEYGYKIDFTFLQDEKDCNLSMDSYNEILSRRKDFIERMIFKYGNDTYNYKTISDKVYKDGKVCMNFNDSIYDNYYRKVIFSYLNSKYELGLDIVNDKPVINISGKGNFYGNMGIFPPDMFITFKNNRLSNKLIFSIEYTSKNIYNINHPLSKFFIENGLIIKNFSQQLFYKLISVLSGSFPEFLMDNINYLMDAIRNIPNIDILVTDDLYVTEDDIYIFDDEDELEDNE